MRHSVPLEMLFLMVSFLAEIDSVSFWLKTVDYSKAFCFTHQYIAPHLKFCHSCSALSFLAEILCVCMTSLSVFGAGGMLCV